ncbi:MAG: hypothetical protein E2O76_13705 [Caldithrix sp.]|nr:MAG: hypothetical protein E2O76_13705 [Caldithrix sp.]
MNLRATLYGLLLFTFLVNIYCSDDIGLTEFDQSVYPSQPSSLTVSPGDGVAVLKWSHPQAAEIDIFNIYRQSSTDTTFMKIDSTEALTYTDVNVNNGNLYTYGVVAVKNGFESARTISRPVSPAIFSVFINSGNEFTNSRLVELTLIAPQETTFMQISNEPSFTGVQWEPFFSQKRWTLAVNDGEKTVSAKFRDADDNKSFEPATDTIILDTKAVIIEVTENSGGQPKSTGEIIHFTLNAGETDGTAFVDIGNSQRNIPLFDNGTSGDDVEDDGIYKRDFQIPSNLEVTNVKIIGRFTDRVGNVAQSRQAEGFVTIQNPPKSVTLLTPETIEGSSTSLRLSWTQNNDPDFASYKLYRSLTPGVTKNSTLVSVIEAQSSLSLTDSGLDESTTYYYVLYVFDTSGLDTASEEVSGTTLANEPPKSVTLLTPETIEGSSTSLRISWTQNSDPDFASFKLYRSLTPGVTKNSTLVSVIGVQSSLSLTDSGLDENTTYYYVLYVFDTSGLDTASEEVSGTTLANEPPKSVTLAQPVQIDSTLRLSWSRNSENDFDSYRVYRSQSTPVDTLQAPIIIINSSPDTSYDDSDIQQSTDYYYRVLVFDKGGLSTGSNEVMGRIN